MLLFTLKQNTAGLWLAFAHCDFCESSFQSVDWGKSMRLAVEEARIGLNEHKDKHHNTEQRQSTESED